MAEIKILIRIDETKNKIGYVIENGNEIKDILILISALEIIKQQQMKKLENTFHAKKEK